MFTRALRHTRSPRLRRLAPLGVSLALIAAPLFLAPAPASAAASANLDQCANGPLGDPVDCTLSADWVNGNVNQAKASYLEGDSLPYRLVMGGLSAGSHTVTIEWDTMKSGKHALDYITTFNRTVDADPCAGVSGCGSPTTFAIPTDPSVSNAGVTQIPGDFTLYNGTITGVGDYTTSGGDASTSITIAFTTTAGSAVLAWAAHIATRADWGMESSAVAIPGSPYHTRLLDLDGFGGNQDRVLSASAVIFPGSITIIKDARPDSPDDFSFSATGGLLPTSFILDDDASLPGASATPNTQPFSGITTFGTYTVMEAPASGWTQSFPSSPCTVTSPNGGTHNAAGATVTINLTEGENVTCTFLNTRQMGTLKVVKDLSPSTDPGLFNLQIDGTTRATDVTDNGETAAVPVTTGSHSVGEVAGAGTSLSNYSSSISCSNGASGIGTSLANVTVTNGANVVCTITNIRKTGTLTVIKELSREGDPGKFNLLIDEVVKAADVGDGGTTGAVTVNTGRHSFREAAGKDTDLADYAASSSCRAGEGSVLIEDESVMIGEGDNVVCTITNARITGALTVSKTTNGGTGTFAFDIVCDDGSEHVVSVVNSGSETIEGIPTGTTCTVTERENPLFSPSVIPADGKAVIDRDGETVAFTNSAKLGGLTLDKRVNAGDHATTEDALPVHSGDSLTYTVVISNTGQVPLTITALSDSLYPALVAACPQGVGSVLAAGASFTCTYTVAAVGDAHNVAAVNAVDELGRRLTVSDATFVDVVHPAITIVKTASPESISGSGTVTYTYVLTNTGDTTLVNVLVTDDILGPIGSVGRLEPGESITMAKTVDVDLATPPVNIGTVVGTDPLGLTVSASDDATITVVLGEVLAQPELPRTGAPLRAQAWAALAMIQVGIILTLAGRRQRVIRRAD